MGIQTLCDRLVTNDAALTELVITDHTSDAELKLILDAAKKNKTLNSVSVVGRSLRVPAALSLASVVSEHPEIQEIEFIAVLGIIEFGPIALAIQQNRNLTRLLLGKCYVTPNLVECIRWLLTKNALESMTLVANMFTVEESSFDLSGALLGNSSLKKLVLDDYYDVIGSETFQAIPPMIRTNQDLETIELSCSYTSTDRHELARLVAQAAEGHASLNKFAITCSGEFDEDVPHHVGTAEAIGMMLYNAPAL
jgi:hypothetical protein